MPDTDVRVTLLPVGRLRVRVQTPDVESAPDYLQVRYEVDGMLHQDRVSGRGGTAGPYAFDVPAGQRTFRFAAPGFAPADALAHVVGGETDEVLVALNHGQTVTGRVIDRRGRPVPRAAVWAEDYSERALADENGKFKLENLTSGRLTIRIGAEGFVGRAVEHEPARDEPVIATLHRGGVIRGRVIGEDELPAAAERIWARSSAQPEGSRHEWATRTNVVGVFRLRVPPGRFGVGASNGVVLDHVDVRDEEDVELLLRLSER